MPMLQIHHRTCSQLLAQSNQLVSPRMKILWFEQKKRAYVRSRRWPQAPEQVLLAAPMKIHPCFDWHNRSGQWMGPGQPPNLVEEPELC